MKENEIEDWESIDGWKESCMATNAPSEKTVQLHRETLDVLSKYPHLTASQRAVIAFDLLPLLQGESKERQRQTLGRGIKGVKNATTNGKSTQFAAKLAKANSAYVEKVKLISKKAPEFITEIRSGKMSINEAMRKIQDLN